MGWGIVGGGVVLVLVGVVLLVGPGPAWLVLWLGVVAMVLGPRAGPGPLTSVQAEARPSTAMASSASWWRSSAQRLAS